jgi:hypothetical protein
MVFLWLILIPLIALVWWLHKQYEKLAEERRRDAESFQRIVELLGVVLIMVHFIQTIGILSNFNFAPSVFHTVARKLTDIITFDILDFASVECFQPMSAAERLGFHLLFLLSVFFLLLCTGQFRNAVILFQFLYEPLLSRITEAFNCPAGTLSIDPTLQCKWASMQASGSIPLSYQSIAVAGFFGVLLVGMYPLWLLAKTIDPNNRDSILSSLYISFEPEFSYWQLTIMGRKLLLLLVEKIFTDSPLIQLILGSIILMAAWAAQLKNHPFLRDSNMNECEAIEILATVVILLMIGLADLAIGNKDIVGVVCLVVLLVTLLRILQLLGVASRRAISSSSMTSNQQQGSSTTSQVHHNPMFARTQHTQHEFASAATTRGRGRGRGRGRDRGRGSR